MDTSTDKLIARLQEEKDAIAKAKIIQFLHIEKEWSLKEISDKVKLHPSYISHYLRIMQLPPIVLDAYYSKQISSAHLFILSRLKKVEDIVEAYKKILAHNLTSYQAEELIREMKFSISTATNQLAPKEIQRIISRIEKSYPGVKAKIIQTRIKGKVSIELSGNTDQTSAFIKLIEEKLIDKKTAERLDNVIHVLE